MILFIGGPEIIVILSFIVIFFGSKKIPEVAKSIGRAIREMQDASNEIRKEIKKTTSSIKDDIDITKTLDLIIIKIHYT